MKTRTALLSLSGASLLLALTACKPHLQPPATAALPAVTVSTAPVIASTEPRFQIVTGTVRPLHQAVIAARILGTVTRADLALGQRVSAGQLLVTLDAAELSARVAQAEAALAQLAADYDRERALLAKGATPAATVSTLSDRRHASEAALAEARALLSYTEIRAPFSGTIARRLVNLGDFTAPGTLLFELAGDTDLSVEFEVPANLPIPALGASLQVELPLGPANGTLTEIASSSSDPVSRTRLARIALPAGTATHSGDFARVAWPAGSNATLSIPAIALTTLGQMERVFVIQSGLAQLRLVKTAGPATDPTRVNIAAGLDAGETVVTSPASSLRGGQPVSVQP